MTVPVQEIEGCRRAHRALLDSLDHLTDEQARQPSLLPDWSIGHLLTHVARNADSCTRRVEGAIRGEVVDQYPGGYAGRAAEIAAGAGRSAADLVADVRESAYRLESAWLSTPDEAWERPGRDVSGTEQPVSLTVFRRWREVEVHHVDLGLGFTPADWSGELVARWLPRLVERLPDRTDSRSLLAWLVDRGPAPSLGPW
ncbi:MAG: maleylpyruvate isomerase family mycothiol-dependent enzyme [Actinomycetota bacterium]|nr:maleylpyruvate isomerase family mycothiol-dependent enzyme [Actinomycetota bacterium]